MLKQTLFLGIAISLLLFSMPSCQQKVVFPSITAEATGTYHPGKFVWRDLITKDPASARRFYQEVFGWTFETIDLGSFEYSLIRNNGAPIGGIFPLPEGAASNSSAEWISAMSVPSVQGAVSALEARGGQAVDKVRQLSGRGTTALVVDPQGAILSFMRSETGDPIAQEPGLNDWLWTELWSTDPVASKSFYEALIGYTSEHVKDGQRDYWLLKSGSEERAGIIENPSKDMRTTWVPYIRVSDPGAIASKAKSAGGKVLLGPDSQLRNGNVAILMDPTGAPFIVQKWPM